MDFYQIIERPTKNGIEIYPDFVVRRSKDFMVRGKAFYGIWDNESKLWSTDEYDVQRLIDAELEEYKRECETRNPGKKVTIKRLLNFSSNMWSKYRTFCNQMSDNSHQLDDKLTFANTRTKKTDYVSRRLPYPLEEGPFDAYDELMSTLYDPEERDKLEWAIGSIISGESKDIHKFIVLYGESGSGKSTFLNIVQKLFVGYYTTFEAKALASSNSGFSMEVFKTNPLVAIQHDGDLSKIEDNTKLNSIISHEEMVMNEKYKSGYTVRINCFLFMGTNKPVKITDAKSGIIRRLIDVKPSLRRIPSKRYHALMSQIDFELGAIAYHCLQVYNSMGKNYYSSYRPLEMMFNTDMFFNFIEENYHVFKEADGVSLNQAYQMYKTFCQEAGLEFVLSRPKFREELKSYFKNFNPTNSTRVDGKQVRSWYSGFITDNFTAVKPIESIDEKPLALVLDNNVSLLDSLLADCPAQYATPDDIPSTRWDECKTKLSDIETTKTHYVKPPENHIVIDFDLTVEDGKKSLELNLEAASTWPATYAEFSKSGLGVHLHYIYDGDVSKLSRIYDEGIEIKVFTGKSSLRRRLTKCNLIPVARINSGLPLKGEKPVINLNAVMSEKSIRNQIAHNLRKEVHPGTKPSIDFIHHILEEAYNSGIPYDVTDLRPKVLAFANNSTNQAAICVKIVGQMKFASEERSAAIQQDETDTLVFFDVEVFKNLFIVVWKKEGGNPVKMINPSPQDIEPLLKFKLVGFNCRRYDNHILYARLIGKSNQELYDISQKIINNSKNTMFGEAYNISYTDVYDFSSAGNKKSLKKWEIELGIHHMELGMKWDEEIPVDMWDRVADYCVNDVIATEAVFRHPPIQGDWAARQILAVLSGLSVNDTTNAHSTKIVFGNDKKPQSQFIYTDLSEMFPGYTFENGKSTYRGVETGEGGYVYAEPGMYSDVAVLDIVSMHPTSIRQLNLFGPYTQRFNELTDGRIAIKHKDYNALETLLDGKLLPFVEAALSDNPKFTLKDLSAGLKTVINSAYGLTSASFDNAFRDPRNKDNIVAKRGALFMVDLQFAVQEKGFQVVHIKTDSIKIPNPTQEIIDFVFEFGKKYGYEFEHEETYSRFCLVNDAVYIAKTGRCNCNGKCICDGHKLGWTATGAQFAHPYVFKTLFSKEPIVFADMCETKSVTTALYLDMNENLDEDEHSYHFIGKTGLFCPIKPGCGGGVLLREKDEKYYAVTGTKGYRWLEAEMVVKLSKEDDIDRNYHMALVDTAVKDISEFGDFEWFMSNSHEPLSTVDPVGLNDTPPWIETCECGKDKSACATCVSCPNNGKCITTTSVTHDLFKPPCGNDVPCAECSLIDECALLPF